MCAETAHVLHTSIDVLLDLSLDDLIEWHHEAIAIARQIYGGE